MKYYEVWSKDLGFITGVIEKPDNYIPKENEMECTKEYFKENYKKFHKTKTFDNSKVISFLLMKDRNKATEEIVNMINETYIIKTTRSDTNPEMWVYNEGVYKPEAKTMIKAFCRMVLVEAYTSQLANNVIEKIETLTYIDEEKFFQEQNKHPYLLPVQNGLLNIKTRKLHMFTPEIPFFNKINAFYKPKADCPKIKSFIKEILATNEDYLTIQELFGFCLIREYCFEKAFMFYGSHGRNGKSKLLEILKLFMGVDNVSGVSLQDIEKDDFAMSNLHNKMVNIAGDISNEAIKDAGRFKSLTGRDTVSANRKFKNRINFVNYAKIVFAANELPTIFTITDAFWLRWILIEFPYQFLPQIEIDNLSDDRKSYVKLQKPDIVNHLISRDEFDGLLNFALDGFDRLIAKKDFTGSKLACVLSKDWHRKSNSVKAFIEDMVVDSFDNYIVKSEFLKEYQYYCKKHRVKILSDRMIKTTLKDEFGIGESQPLIDGFRLRVWNGIIWRNKK